MNPRTRRELTRYGAPAAFLVAATIAVLLIKAGLAGDDGATTTSVTRTVATTTVQTPTGPKIVLTGTVTTTTTSEGEYYEIQTGDTLGAIADKYDTTVEELVRLNPDVDPNALRPGARIRVG